MPACALPPVLGRLACLQLHRIIVDFALGLGGVDGHDVAVMQLGGGFRLTLETLHGVGGQSQPPERTLSATLRLSESFWLSTPSGPHRAPGGIVARRAGTRVRPLRRETAGPPDGNLSVLSDRRRQAHGSVSRTPRGNEMEQALAGRLPA